jgi:uncharacterized protein YfiM (DUF2279 family)
MARKNNMSSLNKRILILFVFLFLSVYQICLAQTQSQALLAGGDGKPDSLTISDRWLAWDKLEHFGVSAFLSTFSYEVYHDFYNNNEESSLCFSCGLTFSLGLGKEICDDKRPEGRFSYKDLVADVLGIAAGLWIATR